MIYPLHPRRERPPRRRFVHIRHRRDDPQVGDGERVFVEDLLALPGGPVDLRKRVAVAGAGARQRFVPLRHGLNRGGPLRRNEFF